MSSKEDPNRNKNQHYVPESHFEEFSKDGASVCGLFKKTESLDPIFPLEGNPLPLGSMVMLNGKMK
ncbi:hypothetical protein QZH46_08685 [Pseudomonas corrugata]